MPSLAEIYRTAKSRKLVRTAAIYFSSSMTSLGIVDLISRHYGLTTKTFDVLLTLLYYGYEDKALDLVLEFSQKAIALDADCAEGYKALGFVQKTKGLIRDALNS